MKITQGTGHDKSSSDLLLKKLTPQELIEVETFAAFLLAKRDIPKIQVLTDEISSSELIKLAEASGSFDWLSSEDEDVYTIEDGEEVVWSDECQSNAILCDAPAKPCQTDK